QEDSYFSLGEKYQPDVLQNVPFERLLAETDESPLDIRTVIGQMAEAKDVAVSLLCDRISENTRKIFFQR
ncbi:MAG: TatD family hydrolase, partial [Phocaeicola dorei]|nr:TatD family hydrolase [Phocaeicola dorei]